MLMTAPAAPATPAGDGVLDAIERLVPEIKAAASEIESRQKAPAALTEKLKRAGLFRMLLPRALGGEELHPLVVSKVIETLSRADGSMGWMGVIASGSHIMLGQFPKACWDILLKSDPNVMLRGGFAPKGAAIPVPGGYRAGGKWSFGSGNFEHRWVMGNCMLLKDGKPQFAPNGMPISRAIIVPAESAVFHNTWDTLGLRGTASDDFEIAETFVPEHMTTMLDGPSHYTIPYHRLPLLMRLAPFHASALIGMAQGALEDLADLAKTKRPAFGAGKTLGSDPIFAYRLGELIVRHHALRAYLERRLQQDWDLALSDQPVGLPDIALTSAMSAYIQHQVVDIVNLVFTLAGGTACYNSCPITRRLRDVRTAAQHIAGSTGWFQTIGTLQVDGPPPHGAP